MLWITRSHVHVDRVACPWLIKRFVDSEARFLFVPKGRVLPAAEEIGATPFDVEGVELGHHEGKCSFEAIIAKYDLTDPALVRMAKIVHAADVAADLHGDPIAPGLEAIAGGELIDHLPKRWQSFDDGQQPTQVHSSPSVGWRESPL